MASLDGLILTMDISNKMGMILRAPSFPVISTPLTSS